MKENWFTRLVGEKVVLVPYRRCHVVQYHEWMKSTHLQELTGSEPLSLDEEYRMQESWRIDPNKCTFIVLDKERFSENKDELKSMIGDTNLFLDEDGKCAEAEIMIAEPFARGKKRGWEAMLLMLRYGEEYLGITKYEVKIKMDNVPSIKMFEKMGFIEVSKSDVFQEVTCQLDLTQITRLWLKSNALWTVEHDDNRKVDEIQDK